jgi:hypothetical protein
LSYRVVIEVYVLLSVINVFLGVGQNIYQDANPGDALRSPFTGLPLGNTFLDDTLDTEGLIGNMTVTNSTGGPFQWVIDGLSDFAAIIDIILSFVKFFVAGYVIDLMISIGIPAQFFYIVTVPLGFYVMYMTFVMITNRLGR